MLNTQLLFHWTNVVALGLVFIKKNTDHQHLLKKKKRGISASQLLDQHLLKKKKKTEIRVECLEDK
jgi:hypothetical protein